MSGNSSYPHYLRNIETEYLTGDYAQCWDSWGYYNVVPPFDKFYFILDGECSIRIDNAEYIARKNQLFLLPYNSVQTYHHISENYITKYWFHCTFTCHDKDLFEIITLPHFITVKDPGYVTELFKKIVSFNDNDSIQAKLYQKAAILELLAYYFENTSQTKDKLFKDEKISTIISYIENNIQNDITVNMLSSLVHFHPNYIISFFKDAIGIPPMEYINSMRIEMSKKLLQDPEIPIKEVTARVGFKAPYYFSRIFKQKVGLSPSDYRDISQAKPRS